LRTPGVEALAMRAALVVVLFAHAGMPKQGEAARRGFRSSMGAEDQQMQEEIWTDSAGRQRYAYIWLPSATLVSNQTLAVVVHHGLFERVIDGVESTLIKSLVRAGYPVCAFDQLDHGKTRTLDPKYENMTEEERDFHYFTVHDYDKNNFLDGLEVLKAVNHVIEEEEKVGEETEAVREKQFALLVDMIDKVLEQDDTDKDGRLSYSEFMAGRRRGEALGDLADPRL